MAKKRGVQPHQFFEVVGPDPPPWRRPWFRGPAPTTFVSMCIRVSHHTNIHILFDPHGSPYSFKQETTTEKKSDR